MYIRYDSVSKLTANEFRPGEAEAMFVYNILAPDLLLFTIGLSLAFGFLVYLF